jgi:hypothetical protein
MLWLTLNQQPALAEMSGRARTAAGELGATAISILAVSFSPGFQCQNVACHRVHVNEP